MIRAARLFLSDATKPAIIAAMHQREPRGVLFEQALPEILSDWRDEQKLAAAVRRAIERFSYKDRDLRSQKLRDWPAFQASKCRTTGAFERAYSLISISSLNDAELFYDASMGPRGEDDISLHVVLNRYQNDAEMGRKLLRLYDACVEWRHIPFRRQA
jgi:hypothetical protein